ncbi:Benzoate transport protein [Burkholderia multivorans]
MYERSIQQIIDDAPLGRFHWRLLAWCATMIVFDGYDLAVMGVALPSIMKSMSVGPAVAGAMASTALFGMMFGNVWFGGWSERIGRRRAIVICIALFSAFTAAAGFAREPVVFGVCRFLAGLGIGGMMPNVVAQMTEYAPRRIRSTMVAVMFSGYAVGGMLAAALGKWLIPVFGWRPVFWLAGAPLLLIPFVARAMPESVAWLQRTGRADALRSIVAALAPSGVVLREPQPAQDGLAPEAQTPEAAPGVRVLFAGGRAVSTLMFWVACFMCLFMVYALSSWLARLMIAAGHGFDSAVTFVFVLNLGGMAGAIGGGMLADRYSARRVLVCMYLVAGGSIALLGLPLPVPMLFAAVALAGATTIGTQIVTVAYAGQFYAPAARALGVGWVLGVGRIGAIAAPIAIGAIVAMALPLTLNFVVIALPSLLAAAAVALVDQRRAALRVAQVATGS